MPSYFDYEWNIFSEMVPDQAYVHVLDQNQYIIQMIHTLQSRSHETTIYLRAQIHIKGVSWSLKNLMNKKHMFKVYIHCNYVSS